ncbi:MAG TPA: phosphopantothenoylcysteine decarboxylase, partial [Vicinamibacterales bacterium]|nr:phosphopantothenoylcysteine decarboxylase [Vicinamibacterales bacterium]
VAAEALRRGAAVTLITGPTHLAPPHGAEVVAVRSAAQMHAAVMERVGSGDAVIMAAAVADYTPAEPSSEKVRKGDGPATITLNRTTDILGELGGLPSRKQGRPILVGFAAETRNVIEYAKNKLRQKRADLIVANDVSREDSGFDVDSNAVTFVTGGGAEELPLQPKSAVAAQILDRVERLLQAVPAKA